MTERKNELWYNKSIKLQRKKVRQLERVWLKTIEENDWRTYAKERNRLNRMINANKTEIINQKVKECGNDSKKFYSLINSLSGTVKNNPMPEHKSEQLLADTFADFFIKKIAKIRDALDSHPKFQPSTNDNVTKLCNLNAVTETTVTKIISSLKTKTCELDELPTKFLKDCLNECLEIITKIINVSLSTGEFVTTWKTAIVRPLLKKPGLDLTPSNYRPVSNLNFLSKVLEKAFLSQFNDHCTTNNLFPDYQSAYRQHFSCETALIKIVDDVLWSMERQKVTALVCIDLSAAFDTVDHIIPLDVLNMRFGICDTALQWVNSYLRPRNFKVNIGESYSLPIELNFSVPQGSVAGPTFYSTYASTMEDVVPKCTDIHGYVDDHALKTAFESGNAQSEQLTVAVMEKTLQDISQWMSLNRLKMNDSKTEFILIGSKQQLLKSSITNLRVSDVTIDVSDCVKLVGAHLDSQLSFKKHISEKCKIACFNLSKISLLRKYLTRDSCALLVLSLVIVHLDYSNALFIGLPDKSINKLQRVQNMAAKLVLKAKKYDSNTACLKELHWLPIKQRVKYKVLITVWKCMYNQAPDYLKCLLVKNEQQAYCTRRSVKFNLVVPKTKKKTFADRSFSVQGPILWNELPLNLKNCNNLNIFKKSLKTYLFKQYFGSLYYYVKRV